jgi:hypothetical protein
MLRGSGGDHRERHRIDAMDGKIAAFDLTVGRA